VKGDRGGEKVLILFLWGRACSHKLRPCGWVRVWACVECNEVESNQ
jgi:hypothetical protein